MDVALRFLGYRARSVRETERYLDERQYGEFEVQQVIDRLMELNLLNDRSFADDFIRTRLQTKPVSRRHLYEQLYQHELPNEVIEEALQKVTDEMEADNARQVAAKYFEQIDIEDPFEKQQRVLQRLAARGFDFDTAKSALQIVMGDTGE